MRTLVKSNGTGNFIPTIPSFFDDFLTKDLFDWSSRNKSNGTTLPAVNVVENADNFELEVAAPGMNKKDFKVELDNDRLVISATKESKEEVNERNYNRLEFSYQNFQRTFTLPEHLVQGDEIEATYKDGILHIIIPKTESAKTKPVKQIQIA